MDRFKKFLMEQEALLGDGDDLGEVNFGLKPRQKLKLKSAAKLFDKKPNVAPATDSADNLPTVETATVSDDNLPTVETATVSDENLPPVETTTVSDDNLPSVETATVSDDNLPSVETATVSDDNLPSVETATVSDDNLPTVESATVSDDNLPPVETATVSDENLPTVETATVSDEKLPPVESATVSDENLPNVETATDSYDNLPTVATATVSADNLPSVESATVSADNLPPVETATVSDENLPTVETATVSDEKLPTVEPATASDDNLPTVEPATVSVDVIETFKREFAAGDNHVYFMLRNIKPAAPGVEHSSFRRSKLFANRLGVEVTFVTNQYQNDLLEQLAAYDVYAPVLNMYDYYQEIDRAVEKPRKTYVEPMHEGWKIERMEKDWRVMRRDGSIVMYCSFFAADPRRLNYINYFNAAHKKIRRDYYDVLGFLSCRQELDDKERPQEIFYYRPDGTLAAHEFWAFVKDKMTVTLMELIDRNGTVTKVFNSHEAAISHWLLNLFGRTKNCFLLGDRKPEYNRTYIDLKAGGYDNVRVIHQVHNIHVVMGKPGVIPNPHKDPTVIFCGFLGNKNIKSDAIITLTEQQQIDITQRYKLDNVITIPHALDNTLTIPDVKVDPFKIVQVGRIVEEKGQAKAVEVMRRVLKKVPQATLHFYGKGVLQSAIQKLIDDNRLSKHIKFEGFSKNMPEVFASSALSILPSRLEGFALVVQESLQAGTPVVAFDCTYGPADMIQNGVNGFLVPVNDTRAMADRIIRILMDRSLRQKLASNCVPSLEKFSPQVVAGKWAGLLLKLMRT